MLEQKLGYEAPKKRSWLRNLVLYGTAGLAALVGGCEGCGKKEVSFIADSDIYTMNEDGSDKRNVTNTANEREENYSWSTDGKRIAFNIRPRYEIFIINKEGSKLQNILPTKSDNLGPSWSPDGTKIAFYTAGKLFVMNSDGGDVKQIGGGAYLPIKWSPDGKMISTPSYATHPHRRILIFSAAGGILREFDVAGIDTAWFSDSKLIIERGEYHPQLGMGNYVKSKLKIYDLDKKVETDMLCNIPDVFNNRHSLSPNRKQIAFLVSSNLYVSDVNSANTRKLTDNVDSTPLWSPDSKKLLFERENDLYTVDLNGRVTNVTNTPNEKEKEPQWVP